MVGPRLLAALPHPVAVMEPIDLYGLDYIGLFNLRSRRGYRYVIIGVEYFSRVVDGEPLLEATAVASFKFLSRVARLLGWPLATYTDNRSHFRGDDFTYPCSQVGIKNIWAPVTSPWSVGLSERMVQIVIAALRAIIVTGLLNVLNWDLYIPAILKSINTRRIERTGFSPFEILMGF